MTAVLTTLLTLFVALVGPNGSAIFVAPSQIVAIIESPGVGACPTTLITMSQPVYVCESAAEVKRKLEAIYVTDLISPRGPIERNPGTIAVGEALRKYGITGVTIAGGHGTTAKQADITSALAQN